jgi:excisionase family DNA binding protein
VTEWVTVIQAARYLGIADVTVRSWIGRGLLKASQRGGTLRVSVSSIEEVKPKMYPPFIRGRNSFEPIRECGDMNGYSRHRRAGEEVCPPCRDAYNEYHRLAYHRRKKQEEEA